MAENERRYVQKVRAASVEVTKRRILDAATDLLSREPAQGINVDRIAREAGVARSTVYVAFESRTGLFQALARDFLAQQGFDQLVAAVRNPDAREALVGSLREGTRLYAGGRDLGRALFSLSLLDPDAAEAIVVLEHGRAPAMRALAQRLKDQGYLRPGIGVTEASDVLWLLTSFDTFDQLFTGRGLSEATVAKRVVAMAERELLVAPAGKTS
jgi:AcrR family transcriptional regulator